jgi:hypothetical protein
MVTTPLFYWISAGRSRANGKFFAENRSGLHRNSKRM